MLGATFFALLCAEVIARLAHTNRFRHERGQLYVPLVLRRGNTDLEVNRASITSDTDTKKTPFRVSERGYIIPSHQHENPDYTIACIGGSTTECVAVAEEQRWPNRISSLLEREGIKVNAINAALSGRTLHGSINVLFNHLLEDRPQMVMVMHAVNDLGVISRDHEYGSRMAEERTVTAATVMHDLLSWSSRFSGLVGLVREAKFNMPQTASGWHQHIDTVPPLEPFEARLKVFVAMCRAFEIVPVLVTQPFAPEVANELTPDWASAKGQLALNQVTRTVGADEGVLVIDLAGILQKKQLSNEALNELFYDGIHVTDKGAEFYATTISEAIQAVIEQAIKEADQG